MNQRSTKWSIISQEMVFLMSGEFRTILLFVLDYILEATKAFFSVLLSRRKIGVARAS